MYSFETSEHAYQRSKFWPSENCKDKTLFYEFMMLVTCVKSPRDAASLGRLKSVGETHIPKFDDLPEELQAKIAGKTLSQIVRLYQEEGIALRDDWEEVKDQCMLGKLLMEIRSASDRL